MNLVKDDRCFVCGRENPRGLRIEVKRWERGATFRFLAEDTYKGWAHYLHGGVISMLFDELLGWTSRFLGYTALTARLEVRYKKPVPLGSVVTFRSELEREAKRLLYIRTAAYLEDGTLAAEGKGTMMVMEKGREGTSPPNP